jgi:hypothetical protein
MTQPPNDSPPILDEEAYRRFALAEAEWVEAREQMRAAGTDPDALLEEARQEAWERYRQEHGL